MAWSGGIFSRVRDWTADEGSAINMEAVNFDQEDDNLAAGINDCLHKGGQNSMTDDLDIGGNAIVNALSLEIQDASATDTVTFSHDGTDFNTNFVGTTDWNISASVVIDTDDAGPMLTLGDGAMADEDVLLRFNTDRPWEFLQSGEDGSATLSLRPTTDSKSFVIEGTTGTTQFLFLSTESGTPQFQIRDSGGTDFGNFFHNGTNFNNAYTNTATVASTGASVYTFDSDLSVVSGGFFRINDAGNTDYLQLSHDGINANIRTLNTNAIDFVGGTNVRIRDGASLTIFDAGDSDSLVIDHDGTDLNFTLTNTTDWNISGVTAIQAGAVDADFDAVTATSYGGITEANLVSRSVSETITGNWDFSGNPTFTGSPTVGGEAILTNETGTFDLDWNGFTTTPTTTFSYTRVGSIVVLTTPTLTGTSNTTQITTASGELPASLRPSGSITMQIRVFDNSGNFFGYMQISSAGQVIVYPGVLTGDFTASGTKGFYSGQQLTYTLD